MATTSKSNATTTPPSRREANVSSRRQRILESARTLLTEEGQDGLSMRKLAREADLSVTTLYNLVGSRDEILRALIEDSAERYDSTVMVPESSGDSIAQAMEAFDTVLRYFIDDPAVLKAFIVANIATGYVQELGKEEHGPYLRGAKETVRQCLADAHAEGKIRDVVSLQFLEGQLYVGMELALDRWAFGFLNEDELRVKSLWGAYLTLLAVASPEIRPQIESQLRKLERQGRAAIRSREKRRSEKRGTELPPGEHDWTS